ncbi:MAG TPA: lytic transglycosylase domain-containing protein [Caulobacteraceae bacterium]|jgi:soluble lytic murein transglycosylase-like protein
MRRIGAFLALALASGAALPCAAQSLAPLSARDLSLYATAFDAAEKGDTATADQALAGVTDTSLVGRVQYLELTRAKARTATFTELAAWLKANGDVPGALQVYDMALKKKPIDADLPPSATLLLDDDHPVVGTSPSAQNHAARDAYFSGDVRGALDLARRSGDAWIAGLAAYRLGDWRDAMVSFETIAANPAEAPAQRAAGGFWGARAAEEAGFTDRATDLLKIASAAPDSFYGMIATRRLQLSDDPLGRLIDASTVAAAARKPVSEGQSDFDRLVGADPRAHRAVALAQLGRAADASAEMRAGYEQAPDDAGKALWMGLMFELGPTDRASGGATGEIVLHADAPMAVSSAVYPTPNLTPAGGFTIDKALVYAVVWQESRFNSLAVSPVGAVGLMQMMPATGASLTGDAGLQANPISLFDTGKNLALGQTYLSWLEANYAGYDILRTVAAYNGGPATLARTEAMLGPDADSLMVTESLPFAETRAYVQKVMAAYWTYRRQFGAATRTLDAAAEGALTIDARLDAGSAPPKGVQAEDAQGPAAPDPGNSLEILLRRNG